MAYIKIYESTKFLRYNSSKILSALWITFASSWYRPCWLRLRRSATSRVRIPWVGPSVMPHTTIGACAGQTVRYYGPDWLGTPWDHTGRAPQHRILEGLYQGTHRSQLRAGPTSRRTWTTSLLRHREYGIGRPSGGFPPAHHGDVYPSKVIRHSTRRATRPVGGAGLSSGTVRWRTRKRTDAGGPSGAMDT